MGTQGGPGVPGQEGNPGDIGYDGMPVVLFTILHINSKYNFISIGHEGPQGEGGDSGEYGSLGEKGFRVRISL